MKTGFWGNIAIKRPETVKKRVKESKKTGKMLLFRR
jgi:hypothetical protein